MPDLRQQSHRRNESCTPHARNRPRGMSWSHLAKKPSCHHAQFPEYLNRYADSILHLSLTGFPLRMSAGPRSFLGHGASARLSPMRCNWERDNVETVFAADKAIAIVVLGPL